MKKIVILFFALLLLPVYASAITGPSDAENMLGEWTLVLSDLSSTERSGSTHWIDTVSFTIDITQKNAMSDSEVILTGRVWEASAPIDVYYSANRSEAQIQTGFWVLSLETGLGYLTIDSTVFTSEDGMYMWGQLTATLWIGNKKEALYKGDVSFYRNFRNAKGLSK